MQLKTLIFKTMFLIDYPLRNLNAIDYIIQTNTKVSTDFKVLIALMFAFVICFVSL